jgi:4-aminobutyrate aminotransferase
VQDLESKKPATKEARNIVAKAYENGLLILLGGTYRQSVRLSPPLNLTREQAEEAVGILEKTLKDLGL